MSCSSGLMFLSRPWSRFRLIASRRGGIQDMQIMFMQSTRSAHNRGDFFGDTKRFFFLLKSKDFNIYFLSHCVNSVFFVPFLFCWHKRCERNSRLWRLLLLPLNFIIIKGEANKNGNKDCADLWPRKSCSMCDI